MTILEAAAGLRARKVSSAELTAAALETIGRLNPRLNAFLTVLEEPARARAREMDAELGRGRDRGPLHGIPVAVKDLFLTRGVVTTGGSKLHENFVPAHDAAVVERLRGAGAVLLGKLNMHELAYGITSANPHYGAVRNPWNPAHSPGGSSGGSGAAVAARMACAAMGSDTGGSIRIPASFCGVVGLKPTYGRVSRYGALPLSWSLDHMGPLTRTVRDAALLLESIAGRDDRDSTSARRPAEDFVPEPECSIRGLRIGLPEAFFFDMLDPEVDAAVHTLLARAAALGAEVRPVKLPDMEAVNAVARVILLAEASAALAPHMERRDLVGADVRALLDQGRLVPAVDYVNAQRLRRAFTREFARVWHEVDCLIVPATPAPAPRIGETTVNLGGREEDVRLAATRLVRGVNLLGLPALAMPCGLTAAGLPVGAQIIGPAFQEALVLRVGAALEDAGVGIPPCPVE